MMDAVPAYGVLSLLPVALAIGIAMATRKVVPALFSGVFVGVLIIVGGNPVTATTTLIKDYLIVQLSDSYNAAVLVLMAFIGGFVALMEQSGGAAAFARSAAAVIDNRTRTQLAAWLGGVVVFFSDLGTPLIVGPIFEPIVDRVRLSREKLAWILDSTASPVAVLVPVTGWGVYIMGLIQKEAEPLRLAETDWSALVGALPFAFYPILTVLTVPFVALTGSEIGAMARAERRTRDTGAVYWPESKPLRLSTAASGPEVGASLVWVPLAVLFVTLFALLAPVGFPTAPVPGAVFRTALASGYFFGGTVLVVMMAVWRVKPLGAIVTAYTDGIQRITSVALILLLAWTLSAVGRQLGTAPYIVELMRGNLGPGFVPPVVFLVCVIISIATGSSWGTFAIMFPIVIPMAHALGGHLHPAIGAVLAGSVFGDHCSPISDTTILSSTGAGCDHVDHVKTQLPYAALNGVVSVVALLAAGVTGSWLVLPGAIAASAALIVLFARTKGARAQDR